MNGHLEGTTRGALRRRALLLASALVLGLAVVAEADVSAGDAGDRARLEAALGLRI